MWQEFLIKEFQGIQQKRNPDKYAAKTLTNLELREKEGDIVLRRGVGKVYDAPTLTGYGANLSDITYLSAETFISQSTGTSQEIVIWVAKGTLSAHPTGAENTLASDIDILLIISSHYWDGSEWQTGWTWLNECVLTTLHTIDGSFDFRIRLDFTDEDTITNEYFNGWTLLNVTEDEKVKVFRTYDYSGASDYQVGVKMSNNNHSWTAGASGDVILLMKNYIPYTYLTEMYSVTIDNVVFHKINDELRIGFGGDENRLGLSIKYIKNFIAIDNPPATFSGSDADIGHSQITDMRTRDGLYVNPYNVEGIEAQLSLVDGGAVGTLEPSGQNFGFLITGILDGYQEFVLAEDFLAANGINPINVKPNLKFGTINDRLTDIRLWWCTADSDDNQTSPYYFWFNHSISEEVINTSKSDDLVVNVDGWMEFDHDFDNAYKTQNVELNSALGYIQTQNYVLSWDHAEVIRGSVFAANGYIDKKYRNLVFFSPLSGDAEFQYDVLSTRDYYNYENFDGDDLVGLASLPNQDFILLRKNSRERIDIETGVTIDKAVGYGCTSRRGIVSTPNGVIYPGKDDLIYTNGLNDEFIKNIRTDYRALSDSQRSSIHAVLDTFGNAYHFFNGNSDEYVITEKGFLKVTQSLNPSRYLSNSDRDLWFISSDTGGAILKFDDDRSAGYWDTRKDLDSSLVSTGFAIDWESVDFDIDLISEQIPKTRRFYIDKVWIYYKSAEQLSFDLILDGTTYQSLTIPIALTADKYSIKVFQGANCERFSIRVYASATTWTITNFEMYSIGVLWKPVPVGRYG